MPQIAVFQECVYTILQTIILATCFINRLRCVSTMKSPFAQNCGPPKWMILVPQFSKKLLHTFSQNISIQSIDLDECISQSLWAATSFSEVGEQKPSQFIGFFYSNSAFSLQLVWRGSRTSQTFPYEFVTNQA